MAAAARLFASAGTPQHHRPQLPADRHGLATGPQPAGRARRHRPRPRVRPDDLRASPQDVRGVRRAYASWTARGPVAGSGWAWLAGSFTPWAQPLIRKLSAMNTTPQAT